MNQNSARRLLSLVFVTLLCPLVVSAGGEPLTIQLGEPSVWSLEQAHYLLSRMRAENQGLKTKTPSESDLDLNTLHSARIRALQSMAEVAAEFNQADAVTGPLATREYEAVVGRRVEIRERLNGLREARVQTSTGLARDRAALGTLSAGDPARDLLASRIASQEVEQATLEQEIGLLAGELETLATSPTSPTATSAPGTASGGGGSGGTGLVDSLLGSAFAPGDGFGSPKLHASNVLDNFIQMQYEIIAKQVSLLRDEVGPNQRLLFLELPHSIYSVPGKGDRYLARAEWKLTHVCRLSETYRQAVEQALREAAGAGYSFQMPPLDAEGVRAICNQGDEGELTPKQEEEKEQNALRTLQTKGGEYLQRSTGNASELWQVLAADLAGQYPSPWKPASSVGARTVDLIPRQSALNVNEIHKSTKGFAFTAKFLSVFGFGSSGGYQRQKENFDQFVHQDVFASAFGKGLEEFGWTFGPLPGTQRVAPGVRNTFAVLAVPRDVIALKLTTCGYGHRMKRAPVSPCKEEGDRARTFVVPLPTGNEGFYVTDIGYTSVPSGERAVVELEGPYFSPQIGVLINGTPLERVVAIARPDLAPRGVSTAGARTSEIQGEYEVVNTRKLKMAFSMPEDYEGTPIISLVTPEKASPINYYRVRINRSHEPTSLHRAADTQPMFIAPLGLERLVIKSFTRDAVVADLEGRGFRPGAKIRVNGEELSGNQIRPRSTQLYEIIFPFAPTDIWEVRLSQSTHQGRQTVSETFPNGVTPALRGYEILDFETPSDKPRTQGFLAARLDLDGLLASDPDLELRDLRTAERVRCDATVPGKPPGGTALQCRRLSSHQLWIRVAGRVPALLEVLWPTDEAGEAVYSTLFTLTRPDEPDIRKIAHHKTQKAEGETGGGYSVLITGRHLDSVRRVFFGSEEAKILRRTPGLLEVVAPPHAAGKVYVQLESDLLFRGRLVTNASDTLEETAFTYVSPPPPKK